MATDAARQVNWDDVRDPGVTLDPCIVKAKIESLNETLSSKAPQKAMFDGTFRVVAGPSRYLNLPIRENFVIGNDKDPRALDPAEFTKTVGMSRLKQVLKKAGVSLGPNLSKCVRAAIGQVVLLDMDIEIDDGSRDPKYKGRKRNKIVGFYAVGERKPGLHTTQDEEPAAGAVAAKTGDEDPDDAPYPTAAPVVDPDDDDVRPTAAARQ